MTYTTFVMSLLSSNSQDRTNSVQEI